MLSIRACSLFLCTVAYTAADVGIVEGLFESAEAEVGEETTLHINGTIPLWLDGDYLKNSASKFGECHEETRPSCKVAVSDLCSCFSGVYHQLLVL